jgi:general secretion pathway protein F
MATFRYTALSPDGAEKKGQLEADGEMQARTHLRESGLIPLTLTSAGKTATHATRRQLTQSQVVDFTRQISELLKAGLPLERALANVSAEGGGKFKALIDQLRESVASGQSLSAALAHYPRDFSDVYRAMVEAAESSGDMPAVMQRLAQWLEARAALRARLLQACIYPAIVIVVAITVVGALLAFVVPQVVGVFASTRQKLPPLTTVTLMLSQFLRDYWLPLTLAAIAGAALLGWALRQPALRRVMDAWLLTLPVAGRLLRDANASRFAATLGALAGAGVPILKALEGAAQTLTNQAMRAAAERAAGDVREGSGIARALQSGDTFPPTLITFLALGEQSGRLAHMAGEAAARLATGVERRTLWLVSVLEPALILAMGIMVLLIVLAVLLPIVQLNTLVR